MNKLALVLPWLQGNADTKLTIDNPATKFVGGTLGSLTTGFANIAFVVFPNTPFTMFFECGIPMTTS